VLVSIGALLISLRFVFQIWPWTFKVVSVSMSPTLEPGDAVFANRFAYWKTVPSNGDLVVFRFPTQDKNNPHYGKSFVFRVCAVAGDMVVIRNKQLFVNEVKEENPQVHFVDNEIIPKDSELIADFQQVWLAGRGSSFGMGIRDNFGPIKIPDSHVFVLGDNRDRTYDSRYWGPLPVCNIIGKATRVHPNNSDEPDGGRYMWPTAGLTTS